MLNFNIGRFVEKYKPGTAILISLIITAPMVGVTGAFGTNIILSGWA